MSAVKPHDNVSHHSPLRHITFHPGPLLRLGSKTDTTLPDSRSSHLSPTYCVFPRPVRRLWRHSGDTVATERRQSGDTAATLVQPRRRAADTQSRKFPSPETDAARSTFTTYQCGVIGRTREVLLKPARFGGDRDQARVDRWLVFAENMAART